MEDLRGKRLTAERNYEMAAHTWEVVNKRCMGLYEDLEDILQKLAEIEGEEKKKIEGEYDKVKAELEEMEKEECRFREEMERAEREYEKAREAEYEALCR